MIKETNKRRKIYFSEVQRKWSALQADASMEMIDGLERHSKDEDMLDGTSSTMKKAA